MTLLETIAKALYTNHYKADSHLMATWDGLGRHTREFWLDQAAVAVEAKDEYDDETAWLAEKEKFAAEHPEMGELAKKIVAAHSAAISRGEKLEEYALPLHEWLTMADLFKFYAGGANYGKPTHPKMHFLVRGIPVVAE